MSTQVVTPAIRGSGVECPICSAQLRFFLPFGVGGKLRASAFCPACSSLERDRAGWLHLTHNRALRPGLRLLHVAPEACLEPRLRHVLGDGYVTADLVRDDVDYNVSVEELPFPEARFDAVICNHVLEHVTDDRRAMRELYRVLIPGGWALLQVPLEPAREQTLEDPSVTSPAERRRRFGQHDHVRSYGQDYSRRLREAGFEVEPVSVRDEYDTEEIRCFGLVASDTVFFCRRPGGVAVAHGPAPSVGVPSGSKG
jgi:SAM-dependent methyltransferase